MSESWSSKDPDAVLDYVYRIPLGAADSVASASPWVTRLSGTVTIVSQSLAGTPDTTDKGYGQDVTVWLSGGVDGETDVFQVGWTTVGTRVDDDIITLAVVSKQITALVLTGYAKPLPAHLAIKYPAFAGVATDVIQFWLTDAERSVTSSWRQADYAAGLMALAAHNMAASGLGVDAGMADVPGGVTSFSIGSLKIGLTNEAANAKLGADYSSTRYGAEFRRLLMANLGGPVIIPTGAPLDGIWPALFVA